ncbi:MAG: hypothetical protein Fur0021_37650 [Candidatus Promineifilaceae bacterium]
MPLSALHQEIESLPALLSGLVDPLARAAAAALPPARCWQAQQVYLTGCGDSHHAAVGAALAFRQLAGLPCEPLTALSFSRYRAPYLVQGGAAALVIAISVSGSVTRTIEALDLGRQAGAWGVAVTGGSHTPLAQVSDAVIETSVPPLINSAPGLVTPGMRSYAASQLALYLAAIQVGQERDYLSQRQATQLRLELTALAAQAEQTVTASAPLARHCIQTWNNASHFVFAGSGPNYGAALFSAAKILEASGDPAVAQDLEEWAHLQYFSREPDTPTILLTAAQADADRAQEVIAAALTIGRRVAVVAPTAPAFPIPAPAIHFPLPAPARECFSPLLTTLPGALLAACRADLLGEPYFRAFGGGRSRENGGGISRIRTSRRRLSL